MNPTEGVTLGAVAEASGVHFAAWSDKARRISVVLYDLAGEECAEFALERSAISGIFSGIMRGVEPGALYKFRVDEEIAIDPYARELPQGVHGPARVVRPLLTPAFPKRRVELERGEVIYELHVGAFTPEGTFESAARRLADLKKLGVTVVELMPIAAFAGQRGWGYDGVALFAPHPNYGTRDELNAFIDAAHALELSVILDVVYNHLGPAGNALPIFSDSYFSERTNAWGHAPALEKPPFRRLVLDNARYWLETLGFDGLRLDATHELEPGGDPHILQALAGVAHGCSPKAVLIAEDCRDDPAFLFGLGVDGVWSDDFHHVAHVLLTHERDGYYADYRPSLSDLARTCERGQLYEGQPDATGRAHGKPVPNVTPGRFVFTLQNHDQIGNRACGERLHDLTGAPAFRAMSLLLIFLPATPLLFMGQEWAASSPFLYFTDHAEPLGEAITRGRRNEFAHFAGFAGERACRIPNPQLSSTFERSKLDWSERELPEHASMLEFYRAALALRARDPVLSRPSALEVSSSGALLVASRRNEAGERLLEPRVSEAELLLASEPREHSARAAEIAAKSACIFALRERRSA
jgi:maltooligosyltrehalose trehalohydrolase